MTDYTRGGTTGLAENTQKAGVLEMIYDYDVDGALTAALHNFINIPAGFVVLHVALEVITACNATVTLIVGDGTDPNGYITSTDATSVAVTAQNGAYTTGTPKLYTSADTIDVTVEVAATTAGKFAVRVFGYNAGGLP